MNPSELPVVALTLGDPAGIGPELIARLLGQTDASQHANLVLVGDPWLWADGQQVAGLQVATRPVASLAEVRGRADTQVPAWFAMDTVAASQVQRSQAQAAGGASVLKVLNACMDAARSREIDAICFAS